MMGPGRKNLHEQRKKKTRVASRAISGQVQKQEGQHEWACPPLKKCRSPRGRGPVKEKPTIATKLCFKIFMGVNKKHDEKPRWQAREKKIE